VFGEVAFTGLPLIVHVGEDGEAHSTPRGGPQRSENTRSGERGRRCARLERVRKVLTSSRSRLTDPLSGSCRPPGRRRAFATLPTGVSRPRRYLASKTSSRRPDGMAPTLAPNTQIPWIRAERSVSVRPRPTAAWIFQPATTPFGWLDAELLSGMLSTPALQTRPGRRATCLTDASRSPCASAGVLIWAGSLSCTWFTQKGRRPRPLRPEADPVGGCECGLSGPRPRNGRFLYRPGLGGSDPRWTSD
jgi:hypothetical protein